MSTHSEELAKRFLRAVRVGAWLTLVLAVAVLLSWLSGVETTRDWLGLRGTKPLSAVCLALLAISALLLSRGALEKPSTTGRGFAVAGMLIGISSLLEYAAPIDVGLASLVARWLGAAPVDPRMPPLTALAFALLGVALFLLSRQPRSHHCPAQWLALGPFLLSTLALVGHAYEVVGFYQIGPYPAMAPPTALGMLLLSLATGFCRPLHPPMALFCAENLGGYVARRVVPAALVFPVFAGWLRLEGEKHGLFGPELGVAVFAVANILFFTLLIASVAQQLAQLDIQRNESAVLLRGTLEGTEDFVAIVDRDVRWIAFNDAHRREFRAIYGREPQLGDDMLATMGMPQDAEAARSIWSRALAGEAFRITQEFGDPRRARKWYEIRFTPIRNSAGQVIAAAQIVRDMTAWHEARESLRQARDQAEHSRNQQQAIVQSMAEGVVVFDRTGTVLDANRSALVILGFASLAELREKVAIAPQFFEVLDADGRRLPLEAWPNSRALRGETFTDYELLIRRIDGSRPIFVGFGAAPVRDAAGEITLAVVTLRDITKEREAEHQLAEAKRQLEAHAHDLQRLVHERTAKLTESLHEMERFSYSLSHDMRAPLRAMKGFTQMLELEYRGKLDENGQMYLARINSAAGRLDQLIQDVLTYSRIVRESIKLEPVDVEQLLRQLIDENPLFQPPAADITVDSPIAPVMGHVAYLTQVLSNLLGNAVKFVAPGDKPRVRIWSESHGKRVRLNVQDNGIGIALDAQTKLFGMFQRLNPSYEGTGIGLNIVRKAVERMRGTIGVESEPGRGTTFWVELRAARSS